MRAQLTQALLVSCFITIGHSVANAQTTWYVDDDNCPGLGLGTLADPFCAIQDGMNAAVDGDEVLVSPGTYFEAINFLGKAIVLRSVDGAAVTTIDGTGLNDSVVKCVNGEGLDTILDGFTITGGIGTFGAALGGGLFGGGMYNHAANPTVVNCIFTANNGARAGGGMFNHSSNPAIANCIFSHNAPTDWGGGMFNYSSNPSVSDCEFIQNIGTADGAGMFNDLSSPTVTNCTFSGNSVIGGAGGQGGGGMHNTANCNPIVTTCTFIGNTAGFRGGGMWNRNCVPTLIDCTFSENSAGNTGGGIHSINSNPTMTNCTFLANMATSGGGMYNVNSDATIIDCTFSLNTVTRDGGGIYNLDSNPNVSDCVFVGNHADGGSGPAPNGGGGIFNDHSNPRIITCVFEDNVAVRSGGGGIFNNVSSPVVEECLFLHNDGSGNGGAIMNWDGSNARISACIFDANTASDGGALASFNSSALLIHCRFLGNVATGGTNPMGGAAANFSSASVFANCLFDGNAAVGGTAFRGGGAMANGQNSGGIGSDPTVVNCVFVGNSASASGVGGAVVNVDTGNNPTFTNCIFWDNADSSGIGSLSQVYDVAASSSIINFSDVQGGWTGAGGIGNVNIDPLFADPLGPDGNPGTEDDDLRLLPGSPCIDAGDNAAVPPDTLDLDGDGDTAEPIPLDLDGNLRFVDADGDGIPTVDMGVYEFQLELNLAPTAVSVVQQLTDIGSDALVRLDGSESSDPDDDLADLAFTWTIDGDIVCNGPATDCATIEIALPFGAHDITLRVTDPDGAFDESATAITLDPAALSVLQIDKVKVDFGHVPARVTIKGEIGLPFGVDYSEVLPMALVNLHVAGVEALSDQPVAIMLEEHGGQQDHWKYRDDEIALGIGKLDIDWKGARFRFEEPGVPIKLKSQIITSTETILELEFHPNEISGAFSIDFAGLATVSVDAAGNVTADVPFEVEDEGDEQEITLTLPFGLTDTMVFTATGAVNTSVNVGEHMTASIGRFRLDATFDGSAYPAGALTTPRELDLGILLGAQFYPGATTLGPVDLRVDGEKWKEQHD